MKSNALKYFYIFWYHTKVFFGEKIKYKFNLFIGIIGSFCFVSLYFFTIFFLMQNVSIGNWTLQEMWVLLGSFYIVFYLFFLLFWKGLIRLTRSIVNGEFDNYLTKPVDIQLAVASNGGEIHNLFALIFGIGVLIYGITVSPNSLSIFEGLLLPILLFLGTINFTSFIFLLLSLSFKYGHLEGVFELAMSFQDFSRYPANAFNNLPIYILIFTIPVSALTTIPSLLVVRPTFPFIEVLIYLICSFLFIYFCRRVFYSQIKKYTSGS